MTVPPPCKWSMGKKRPSQLKKHRLVISRCFLGKSFSFDNKWSYLWVLKVVLSTVFMCRNSWGYISFSLHWQVIRRALWAPPACPSRLHTVTRAQDSSSCWFCSRDFCVLLAPSFSFPPVPLFPVTPWPVCVSSSMMLPSSSCLPTPQLRQPPLSLMGILCLISPPIPVLPSAPSALAELALSGSSGPVLLPAAVTTAQALASWLRGGAHPSFPGRSLFSSSFLPSPGE